MDELGGVDTSFVLPIWRPVFTTFLVAGYRIKNLSEKDGATTGMMYGMPVLIFVFAISAQSGVALYWSSMLTSFLETYFLNNPFKIIAEKRSSGASRKDLEGKRKSFEAQKKKIRRNLIMDYWSSTVEKQSKGLKELGTFRARIKVVSKRKKGFLKLFGKKPAQVDIQETMVKRQ